MTRVTRIALAVAAAVALAAPRVAAQRAPQPAGPVQPAAPDAPPRTDEKAGTKLERSGAELTPVSEADIREAGLDFRQGNDLLNNGLFPQAVEAYTRALGHWDHPAIHYNLALALINLDRPLEVYDHLQRAIALGPDPLETDKYDHAKEYLKLIEGQLASLEVSCDKPGARVSVDGKPVFVAPGKYAARIRAGKHTLVAEKQGYNARITAPFIGPGEAFRVELKLYTAEELTRYHRRWEQAWIPYAVIGAGALAGAVGGGLELSARASYRDYDAAVTRCSADAPCTTTPGLRALRDRGDTRRAAGLVLYGVAGAAITTGAALAWLNRSEPYQIGLEELTGERVTLAPLVAPGVVGAVARGQF
jgi:tetratricopeptide (TPR) repeat protein